MGLEGRGEVKSLNPQSFIPFVSGSGSGSSPTRAGDGAPCQPLFFSSPSHFFATSPLFSFVSVAMATPGSSGGCDERQRRRLGKALMATMARSYPIDLAQQEPPIVMIVRKVDSISIKLQRMSQTHHLYGRGIHQYATTPTSYR
ncbi:hypothetical protein Lal_00023358 [Lupinus albus]|nr:hypothetical protein Lal_00023358 [Lupinus albus]